MTTRETENQFLQFRRSGDPDCLAAVFDHCAPRLLRMALHLGRDPADAEDLVQETFLTAIEKAGAYDASRPLLPWLTGILIRHARMASRWADRPAVERPMARFDGPRECAETRELVNAVRTSVAELPEHERRVVMLRLHHGLQPAEIAEVLGLASGTVRMRLHRALARLRERLPEGIALSVVGLIGGGTTRGLANVRATVLDAEVLRTPTILILGGVLTVKKTLIVVSLLLAFFTVWSVAFRTGSDPTDPIAELPTTHRVVDLGERGVATVESMAQQASRLARTRAWSPDAGFGVRVLHADGSPAVDVGVVVIPNDGSDSLLGRRTRATDATGLVLFGRRHASVRVLLDRDGSDELDARVYSIPVGTQPVFEIRIPRGLTVHCHVVDEGGQPVSGATVWRHAAGFWGDGIRIGTTDALGALVVEDLPAPDVHQILSASLPGCAPSYGEVVFGARGANTDVTLHLGGLAAAVTGRVLDPEGLPVAGAVVRIVRGKSRKVATGEIQSGCAGQLLSTDGVGRFRWRSLRSGTTQVIVHADGYIPSIRDLELVAGAETEARFDLVRAARLHGWVRDEAGKVIAGARVLVDGLDNHLDSRARSAPDGRYELNSVPHGEVSLCVIAEGHPRYRERLTLEPEEQRTHDIELAVRCRVDARLIDSSGEPLVGWQVSLADRSEPAATTDGAGRFTLTVKKGKDYELMVQASRYGAYSHDLPTLRWSADEVVVRVADESLATFSLHGRLMTADRVAVTGTIVLRQLGLGPVPLYVGLAPLDSYGAFVREDLARGRYRAQLLPGRTSGLAEEDLGEIIIDHSDVDLGDIVLSRTGTLVLELTRSDGVPLEDLDVYLSRGGREQRLLPAENGIARRALVPGAYTAKIYPENAAWTSFAIDIRPGEETRIERVLQPGARRMLRFPYPAPPGWDAVGVVDCVLRDAGQRVLYRERFELSEEESPLRYAPGLAVGSYVMELTTETGRLYRGHFVVRDLEAASDPVGIAFDLVR